MYFDRFDVDLEPFLVGRDERVNNTIVELQSIKEQTLLIISHDGPENRFFDHEGRDHFRDRFRLLFRVISQNENINAIEIDRYYSNIHIPGSLLAEWINQNKFVTAISIPFYHEQSDLDMLCDAIKRNNVIKQFIVSTNLHVTQAGLLGSAFRDSKGIEDVTFWFHHGNDEAEIEFLTKALGPTSNIKRSSLASPHAEIANAVADIITANTSLDSLSFEGLIDSLIPILRGVLNSVRSGVVTDFSLCLHVPLFFENDTSAEQLFQMIGDMKNLNRFSFDISNFDCLSEDIIDENLKPLHLLDCLIINITEQNDISRNVIKKIADWEKKCKLHINISMRDYNVDKYTEILSLMEELWLEKLTVSFDADKYVDIARYIPKLKFLKELKLNLTVGMDRENANLLVENIGQELLKVGAAVVKNGSLQNVSINWSARNPDWHANAQIIIDQALSRNNLLAKSILAPTSVPEWQWPVLLEMANVTGLDFSFQIMPYLFSRFLSGEKKDCSLLPVKKRKNK